MAETVDKVAERLAKLEITVAEGFYSVEGRLRSIDQTLHDAELRDLALSQKVDVTAEALRGDVRTVLEAVTSVGEEMRRTTDSIREEHAADRVLVTAVEQHARRIHTLEQSR